MPLPQRRLIDIGDEDRMPNGSGIVIAFGIGLVSWAIVVSLALILLRY